MKKKGDFLEPNVPGLMALMYCESRRYKNVSKINIRKTNSKEAPSVSASTLPNVNQLTFCSAK